MSKVYDWFSLEYDYSSKVSFKSISQKGMSKRENTFLELSIRLRVPSILSGQGKITILGAKNI